MKNAEIFLKYAEVSRDLLRSLPGYQYFEKLTIFQLLPKQKYGSLAEVVPFSTFLYLNHYDLF